MRDAGSVPRYYAPGNTPRVRSPAVGLCPVETAGDTSRDSSYISIPRERGPTGTSRSACIGIPSFDAELRMTCVGVRLPAVSLSNPLRTRVGLAHTSQSRASAVLRGRVVPLAQRYDIDARVRNACVGVRLPAVSLSNPRRTPAGLVHTSLSRALRQSSGSSTNAVLRGRVDLFAP
jgi:hypothetical protein